jgi:hypothetical protein
MITHLVFQKIISFYQIGDFMIKGKLRRHATHTEAPEATGIVTY